MPSSIATVAASTGLALAAGAGALAYAISHGQSQLFGSTCTSPPLPSQLSLTFDDGPNPAITPSLLEVLARHEVRAAFFLIGAYVLREPALTREIAAAGHVIGNHTMTHPFLPRRSAARVLTEMTQCSEVLEDTLGAPVTLFRPPHGGRSPAVFRAARKLNLQIIQWNLIVQDWKPEPSEVILRRMESGIARNQRRQRGTCVVLHDGDQNSPRGQRQATVGAVSALLSRVPQEIKFVTPPDWLQAGNG